VNTVPIADLHRFFIIDTAAGTITRRVAAGNQKAGSNAVRVNAQGYGHVSCLNVQLLAHRAIWAAHHGRWPEQSIDHINGARADNRIANLRDVDAFTNRQNQRRARRDSRSGLIGAIWLEQRKCWKSEIRVAGRVRMIGRYKTAQEAHAAYVEAKRRLHPGCTL
jgi:hypothetical protein